MTNYDEYALIDKKIICDQKKISSILSKIELEKDIQILVNSLDKKVCLSDYKITGTHDNLLIIKDIESQKKHFLFLLKAFENDFLDQKQSLKYSLIKRRYSYKRKNQKYIFNIDSELDKLLFVGYYIYKADFTNVFNTEFLFYWCLIEK